MSQCTGKGGYTEKLKAHVDVLYKKLEAAGVTARITLKDETKTDINIDP